MNGGSGASIGGVRILRVMGIFFVEPWLKKKDSLFFSFHNFNTKNSASPKIVVSTNGEKLVILRGSLIRIPNHASNRPTYH